MGFGTDSILILAFGRGTIGVVGFHGRDFSASAMDEIDQKQSGKMIDSRNLAQPGRAKMGLE